MLKFGIVDFDTSHVVAFTQILNDEKRPDHIPGAKVVAAFKGGSADVKESSSRIDGFTKTLQEKYGDDVRALLQQGSELPWSRYVEALLEMARLRAEAEAAMAGLDAILLPATPYVAPVIGQPLERGTLLGFTRPFNVSGQPVITLPATTSGLPVGIQVIGRCGAERGLVEVALALEAEWRAS